MLSNKGVFYPLSDRRIRTNELIGNFECPA